MSMMVGSLEARRLTVTLSGRRIPVLQDLQLELAPGRVTALLGRSGCGKTTLIKSLNGLVPWQDAGEVRGEILLDGEVLDALDPGQRAHLLASCLDRPEAQLFLATPRHELAAQARLHGRTELADELATVLGVECFMDRRVIELSSGERQRVALAVTLAAAPRPLLLDEPTAHLDDSAVAALAQAVRLAARGGSPVLVAEQAPWRLESALDEGVVIADGRAASAELPTVPSLPAPPALPGDDAVLEARGVVAAVAGRELFAPVDLALRRGEVVLLTGANGVGKSRLARVLAGLVAPMTGTVRHRGARRPALMLPEARLQLFATTVLQEVASVAGEGAEAARVLRRHRLETHAARAPWTLSRGERQRLVHAALDLLRPPVMIIDEPAQGLDHEDLRELIALIHRRAARGRAYLVISHRSELRPVAHRVLELSADGLREVTA